MSEPYSEALEAAWFEAELNRHLRERYEEEEDPENEE